MTKLLNIFTDKAALEDATDDDMIIFKRGILSTIIDSNKYMQVDVKPIEFNLYPQYNSGMFMDIKNILIDKLELKKFPDVIVLNNQVYQPSALNALT